MILIPTHEQWSSQACPSGVSRIRMMLAMKNGLSDNIHLTRGRTIRGRREARMKKANAWDKGKKSFVR